MAGRTIKVTNVSLGATEIDIKEFFSFSGEITYVELNSDNERPQVSYVTFKDRQGAETAVLLSGATIIDQSISVELAPDYNVPAAASEQFTVIPQNQAISLSTEKENKDDAGYAVQKAEDVVSDMLAKGFVLGKDALNKAKAFDDKHQVTSTATATVASFDQKMGLSDKISAGTTIVNEKVKEVDEKYQVTEITKSTLAAAEKTVSNASTAMMKNRYIFTSVAWAAGAFNKVAKAASDVGQKTKEKVLSEQETASQPSVRGHTDSSVKVQYEKSDSVGDTSTEQKLEPPLSSEQGPANTGAT